VFVFISDIKKAAALIQRLFKVIKGYFDTVGKLAAKLADEVLQVG
jgi:hypothetical protein